MNLDLDRTLSTLEPSIEWTQTVAELAHLDIRDQLALAFTSKRLTAPLHLAGQKLIRKHLGSQGTTCDRLLSVSRKPNPRCTGLLSLDRLLQGGWRPGEVVEIAGSRGSGKTLLALSSILLHLLENEAANVTWIDTEGSSFSPERAYDILSRLFSKAAKGEEDQAMPPTPSQIDSRLLGVLERLTVHKCSDPNQVREVVDALREEQTTDEEGVSLRHFLVIDTITTLFQDRLSGISSHGHASMAAFMKLLSVTATMPLTALTVMVINSSVSAPANAVRSAFSSANSKPALGPTFTHLTDRTLWCDFDPSWPTRTVDGIRQARVGYFEISRSHSSACSTWSLFASDGLALYEVD